MGEDAPTERLAIPQRAARRRLRKAARKQKDEPLSSEDYNAADPGLKDDLGRLVGQTTDDLGPIR